MLLDILLSILEVFKHVLEVLVAAGILQLLLELGQLFLLFNDEELFEFFFLLLAFCLVLGKILLELILDLLDDFIHLSLLFSLVIAKLNLHLVKLLGKLLPLLAPGIESASQELVLATLILLHHVFHSLNLVLEFTDKAFDFLAGGTLLLEQVLEVGATIVSTGDLLLKNGVLLAVDIDDNILLLIFQVVLELLILCLAPVV